MKDRTRTKKALFQISKVLWHLDIFRRSFRELSGHTCMLESCIFCALKELFSQLQFSHESALPPDALRRALAESFFDQQRFQLGFMDDAAECFENILLRIHYHLACDEVEDLCSARHCIPHVKFAMTLVEQSVCGACGATSEPLPFTQMVHYVSASALISQARQAPSPAHPDLFGQLLKKAGGMGDIRDCPSACGAKIQIRRTLTNHPEIVSVGIVWDSDRPSLEHIMSLLVTLRTTLRLSDVFHTPPPLPTPSKSSHQLVGVVTYYGKHYSTFFFHTKLKIWIYFDDANVREVGPKWEQVVEKCRRGRYQPLLLLFAAPDGTPVDSSTAPKGITVAQRALGVTKLPDRSSDSLPAVQQARRSLTPSPEKPNLGALAQQRRALTPNPQQQIALDPHIQLQKHNGVISEYQNVSQMIQKSIPSPLSSPTRTAGSWNGQFGALRRGMGTELVRRDSGNWSGDRNSASSSSSTSLENPYQYIIGKMPNRGQAVPRSPTSLKGGESSSSGSQCDPGYDSYSLSSTDSLPLQQTLKHNLQLAQIPEGHQSPVLASMQLQHKSGQSECERLCEEADLLLKHSQATDDLEKALSFANAAVGKARQAMDAPYSNPQAASAARMKHNTCIMQARSIHKRLEEPNAPRHGEGRHSREGSGCSNRGSSGSHSRQGSRDKGNHSRQNSRELLTSVPVQPEQSVPTEKPQEKTPEKSIEIYATLPKTRKGLLSRSSSKVKNTVEDEEYLMYDRPGRSTSRNKPPNGKKEEKRARSEERNNKKQEKEKEKEKEFISNQIAKEAKKQAKAEEQKNKKQHKIRRKLLMGGLIRRKNRSMPDLREDDVQIKGGSKDDSSLGKVESQGSLSGYLSEGHLEYSGNPNLERSKLMRKSFHGSKLIHMAKVPPPPPLRTTSQLSKNDRPPFPLPGGMYQPNWDSQPQSLPPMSHYNPHTTDAVTYANGAYAMMNGDDSHNKLVTVAQVHNVGSPVSEIRRTGSDEDFILPPYPSPLNSVVHSRQPSEEFPPPPSEIQTPHGFTTLLEQLQLKRHQILHDNGFKDAIDVECSTQQPQQPTRHQTSMQQQELWLKELQAKQEALKSRDEVDCGRQTYQLEKVIEDDKNKMQPPFKLENVERKDDQISTVKDLKSRFENITFLPSDKIKTDSSIVERLKCVTSPLTVCDATGISMPNTQPIESKPDIDCVKSDEIKSNLVSGSRFDDIRRKSSKKKNVTFCEQVVLVATAEEDKSNSYIPNPILERVLRSVLHRDPPHQETKEIAVHSVVPLKRNDSGSYGQCAARTPTEIREIFEDEVGTPVDPLDKIQMPPAKQESSQIDTQLPNGTRGFPRMLPSPMPNRVISRIGSALPHNGYGSYNQVPFQHSSSDQIQNPNFIGGNSLPYSPDEFPRNIANGNILPREASMCQTLASHTTENELCRPNVNNIAMNGDHLMTQQTNNFKQANEITPCPENTSPNPNSTMTQSHSQFNYNQQHSPQQFYNSPYNTGAQPPNGTMNKTLSNGNLPHSNSSPLNQSHGPYQTVPMPAMYNQMNSNGPSAMVSSSQTVLQQTRQHSNNVQNGQHPLSCGPGRNNPSPIIHSQLYQPQMRSTQHNISSGAANMAGQNYPMNGSPYSIKNPSPVPASFLAEHHQLPACNPQLRPYAHQLQQSAYAHQQQQLNNKHGQTQIAFSQPSNNPLATPGNATPIGNAIPSPSLSLKSQNHTAQTATQANQQCYMALPQKMRTSQSGLINQGSKAPRPQTLYQHEPSVQENNQRRDPSQIVYQRVPNPMGPLQGEYPPNLTGSSPNAVPTSQGCPPGSPMRSPYSPIPVQHLQQAGQGKFSPYQHPPPPRQMDSNKNPTCTSPNRTLLCNLCRKKSIVQPAIYCADCDFYMSRFKQRT